MVDIAPQVALINGRSHLLKLGEDLAAEPSSSRFHP